MVAFVEPLAADDPRQVGGFRLQARLGAGGMGRVYLGYSPGGRPVAVKVVHPELARDTEFMHRFRREVAAAQAVSDAYTAAVVGAGPDDSPPWLATTFVPGPPLADLVAQAGPLPEDAVWRLAGGLAEALQAIHSHGLVHRDLKPGNILIAADGPRVIDFGISRTTSGTVVTATQMTIGTPAYMSPEQAQGRPVGPASDIFSLGSVLAFAATGAPPFGGGEAFAIGFKVVHGEPDLARVPQSLRPVIDGCLAKDPAARPTVGQLIEARGRRRHGLPGCRTGQVLARPGGRRAGVEHVHAGPAAADDDPAAQPADAPRRPFRDAGRVARGVLAAGTRRPAQRRAYPPPAALASRSRAAGTGRGGPPPPRPPLAAAGRPRPRGAHRGRHRDRAGPVSPSPKPPGFLPGETGSPTATATSSSAAHGSG